jgi:hypothetical protein
MGMVRGPGIVSKSEHDIVKTRASNFPKKFLKDLGYAG